MTEKTIIDAVCRGRAIDENGLLPCAHCGGKAMFTIGSPKPPGHYVMCTNGDCNMATAMRAVAADAAQDWNRRTDTAPVAQQLPPPRATPEQIRYWLESDEGKCAIGEALKRSAKAIVEMQKAREVTPEMLNAPLAAAPQPEAPTLCPDREFYGRIVRMEWMAWAREQPNPKPSWLTPWEELTEPEREVDRRIGERVYSLATISRALLDALEAQPPTLADDLVARLRALAPKVGGTLLIDCAAARIESDAKRIRVLEAERDRAVEVADAQTKGVYSKYMLEAADAIADARHLRLMTIPDLESQLAASRERERALRELLAYSYGGAFLYRDDGELQDNRALPCIDFGRDSVSEIEAKMRERTRRAAASAEAPQAALLDALEAPADDARDAARYRWLQAHDMRLPDAAIAHACHHPLTDAEVDRYIDAAIAERTKEQG